MLIIRIIIKCFKRARFSEGRKVYKIFIALHGSAKRTFGQVGTSNLIKSNNFASEKTTLWKY